MSLFVCDECNVVENTALAGPSGYWARKSPRNPNGDSKARCSQCNVEIGKWHGRFPREDWDGDTDRVINR